MELLDELRLLIETLRETGLDYALCGGFALAAHGIVRATEDIDLMVEKRAFPKLRRAVLPLGYRMQRRPFIFMEGDVVIHRFLKTDAASKDFLVLDALLVTSATRAAWGTRRMLRTGYGRVPVVSRAGLAELKRMRGSGQDQDDIQKLIDRYGK